MLFITYFRLCLGSYSELNDNHKAQGEWLTIHNINYKALGDLEKALRDKEVLDNIKRFKECKVDAGLSEYQEQDNRIIAGIIRSLLDQLNTLDCLFNTDELRRIRKTLLETLPLELQSITGAQLEMTKKSSGEPLMDML